MDKARIARIDFMANLIRAALLEMPAKDFAIAINNACIHGVVFEERDGWGGIPDSAALGVWYDAIEALIEAGAEIDGG